MKEKIYTIPVTEAFALDCECPMCVLEKRFEDEFTDYILGPSLMEPDGRMETNEKGFCLRHAEILYNKRSNMLGLGLILDTHLQEQTKKLRTSFENNLEALEKDADQSFVKTITNRLSSRQTDGQKYIDELISHLKALEGMCAVCSKLDYTMDRYVDVILYLWFKESDFRKLFASKKGFCLKHLRLLLEGTKKYLNSRESALFVKHLMTQQLDNLERIQKEVNWFTKKFDYRNSDAPWGNSRDALPRSIQKLVGYCNLK